MITPAAEKAIERGLAIPGLASARRRLVRLGQPAGQRGDHRAGRHGADVLGQHARAGSVRRGGDPDGRLLDVPLPSERFHRRARRGQSRADVRPRFRHDVSGRMLRHGPAARAAREARRRREADRQHAERRGRVALSAAARGRRRVGHHLRGDGLAGGEKRRTARAQGNRSTAAPNTSNGARIPTAASCTRCKAASRACFRARRPASSRCSPPASTRDPKSPRAWTT